MASKPGAPRCFVCEGGESSSLCRECGRSYDQEAHDDGGLLEAMAWAARRAWSYARKEARRGR